MDNTSETYKPVAKGTDPTSDLQICDLVIYSVKPASTGSRNYKPTQRSKSFKNRISVSEKALLDYMRKPRTIIRFSLLIGPIITPTPLSEVAFPYSNKALWPLAAQAWNKSQSLTRRKFLYCKREIL